MIKHSQSTQSSKFIISLQYIEEVTDVVHFFHADKQNIGIVFDGSDQTCPKYSK